MNKITEQELATFVNANIDLFHESKVRCLQGLGLKTILLKKNPYLFRAKNINSASDLIREILDAFLYASEEKLFGDFLEELALFVAGKAYGGQKSAATGIDLDFTNDEGVRYLVSIKSGTSWGNSSQQAKQELDFQNAVRVVRQSHYATNVQPALGICYGKAKPTYLRGYYKVVGQSFWELISGRPDLYTEIVEPIGYRAKEHNENFLKEKDRLLNLFTQEFMGEFCDSGIINWKKLVQFNSNSPIGAVEIVTSKLTKVLGE